ncbi:unnamed protein product [Meloidogyne enterolobii]|uniref:Uncharacterized protein n=1 Tax=Meloidogyne enterolobii TaxID=390850 RepID=A0ACB1AKW6_MELEN
MLKFRQDVALSPDNFEVNRKCSFFSSQLGHSKATIILNNISLPLAWPSEEIINFGERKDWREFTVQLVLKSKRNNASQFSKPKEYINRTFTDVEFPEEFIFPDEDPDFCIEAGSMVQAVTHSLGRSLGLSWKKYQQKEEYQNNRASATRFASRIESNIGGAPNRRFLEELRKFGIREERRNGSGVEKAPHPKILKEEQDYIIGFARFCLSDAILNGKIHSYILEKMLPVQNLLPIYGNISAQIFVQPISLITPLAQGYLDIFIPNEGILHQQIYCELQGGQLCCWETNKVENAILGPNLQFSKTAPTFSFHFNGKERLERTSFPTAFRLILFKEHIGVPNKDENQCLLCICPSQHALIGWRNALNLQSLDYSVWAEFGQIQHNSLACKPRTNFQSKIQNMKNDLKEQKTAFSKRTLSLIGNDRQKGGEVARNNIRSTNQLSSACRISLLQVYKQKQLTKNDKITSENVISEKPHQNDSIKSRKKQTQNYVLSLNIRGECINKNDKNIQIQSREQKGGNHQMYNRNINEINNNNNENIQKKPNFDYNQLIKKQQERSKK